MPISPLLVPAAFVHPAAWPAWVGGLPILLAGLILGQIVGWRLARTYPRPSRPRVVAFLAMTVLAVLLWGATITVPGPPAPYAWACQSAAWGLFLGALWLIEVPGPRRDVRDRRARGVRPGEPVAKEGAP